MSTRTTGGALYCSTSDTVFGPTFNSREEADNFLRWWWETFTEDPREVDDEVLRRRQYAWLLKEGLAE